MIIPNKVDTGEGDIRDATIANDMGDVNMDTEDDCLKGIGEGLPYTRDPKTDDTTITLNRNKYDLGAMVKLI